MRLRNNRSTTHVVLLFFKHDVQELVHYSTTSSPHQFAVTMYTELSADPAPPTNSQTHMLDSMHAVS